MSSNLRKMMGMKRGSGLNPARAGRRPTPELIEQENVAAVEAKVPPRQFRISTKINDNAGDILEDMRNIIRKQTGRRPLIAEVLELALEALENEMTGGNDE